MVLSRLIYNLKRKIYIHTKSITYFVKYVSDSHKESRKLNERDGLTLYNMYHIFKGLNSCRHDDSRSITLDCGCGHDKYGQFTFYSSTCDLHFTLFDE